MSNNIYDILGKIGSVLGVSKPVEETAKQTVYESVEPKGDIMEAVKSLESKFATFKEAKAKPDFLDVDGDGNKKEPFKKAVKDKKSVKEGQEEWYDKDGKVDPNGAYDAAGHYYLEREVNEGQGPYELYNPKHPKFKANYDKWIKKNPGKKLADFVAAMKKKEATMNEAAYDEPAAPDAEAIAKRKRLQAIKDRQEDERAMGGKDETNTPIRKVAGKAYGGAAQKDEPEVDEAVRIQGAANYDGKMAAPKNQRERDEFAARAKHERAKNRNDMSTSPNRQGLKSVQNPDKPWGTHHDLKATNVEEVAPPGAKAERMVKHIKKGYSKDGKLSKKEKGIAYATAWKAHNKGQVEEGVEFKDAGKIKNSAPNMKKAKPAKLKESRVMEETDYFYEKVGKALAEQNPYLDTATGEFVDAVRKEMVAQGIPPNRARNIIMMDEDFISDVATSYGHYCSVDAHHPLPAEIDLNGTKELDEISRLAGLPVEETEEVYSDVNVEESPDVMDLEEREQFQSMPKTTAPTPAAPAAKPGVSYDKSKLNPMAEEEMGEGNEFSGALAKAKATGEKEFEVDGKRYTVKEDVNVNISANGEEDAMNLIRKLAGMPVIAVAAQQAEPVIDMTGAEAVEEEREVEHLNTPREQTAGIDAAIPSGTDLNRSKQQDPQTANKAANPLSVKEEALWNAYESMIDEIKQ